jgi:hypothetical protein
MRGRTLASTRSDFYGVRGINADAGGHPNGNFHPESSFMTSVLLAIP